MIVVILGAATQSGSSYFDRVGVLQGNKIVRWKHNAMPLKIFIYACQDRKKSLCMAIKKGLEYWEKAKLFQVYYRMVDDYKESDIVISSSPQSPYRDAQGRTSLIPEGAHFFSTPVSIIVYNRTQKGITLTPQDISRITAHEFGHALGIWGHSLNKNDIMHARSAATRLSQRDLNTLEQLYNTIPDRVNLDKGSALKQL